jgi:antitoxin VapB
MQYEDFARSSYHTRRNPRFGSISELSASCFDLEPAFVSGPPGTQKYLRASLIYDTIYINMNPVLKTRVFMSGRSQAVRIPLGYRLDAEEVYIYRNPQTDELILSAHPIEPAFGDIFALLDSAHAAEEFADFPKRETDLAAEPNRDWLSE